MRKVLCMGCNEVWGISKHAKIPYGGYYCPRCRASRGDDKKKEVKRCTHMNVQIAEHS